MKQLFIFFSLIIFLCACQKTEKVEFDAVQFVDPQIGSVHGRWFFYTPAALPFGMAKLAPHTNAYESLGSWLPGGYDDRHTSIEGFGHFHEFQIGGVVVMPTVGQLKTVPGTLENPDEGYRSRFDKNAEHAEPGYYSVILKDYKSNIDFYKETGWLHDGEAAGVFTNGVQTNFQGLLIASAYNCGIKDFDVENGYKAAVKNELDYRGRNLGNGKYDLHYFVNQGYVPYKDTTISNGWVFNFGGSHTLEYAFSSYAVAQMAKQMGEKKDYEKLMDQAGYWNNLFDPKTKFIRPKLPNGEFIKDFDPMKPWDGFQEGNAFQYTWYVPHDPAGLIKKLGVDLFNKRLETTFNESQKSGFGGGKEIDSFSGVQMLYNQGNQPCLHQSWLFNYSGKPWLTQKWTRIICDEFYGTEPLHGYGFGQDEDQGQLGAWYVMAALGLFDVQGHAAANPTFQFGSPIFEKVTLQLSNDPSKKLIIETKNNAKENYYVKQLEFNGRPIENCWLERKKLMQGGTLTFSMDSIPNTQWGIITPPPSMSTEKNE